PDGHLGPGPLQLSTLVAAHRAEQGEEHRVDHRRDDEGHDHRPPVAEHLGEVLLEDVEDDPGPHAEGSPPTRARKASVSVRAPARSQTSATVPWSSSFPWWMSTTRSQSASASPRTWVLKRMAFPAARAWRKASRRKRPVTTSSAVVGSSSTRAGG